VSSAVGRSPIQARNHSSRVARGCVLVQREINWRASRSLDRPLVAALVGYASALMAAIRSRNSCAGAGNRASGTLPSSALSMHILPRALRRETMWPLRDGTTLEFSQRHIGWQLCGRRIRACHVGNGSVC
jgi:hypothetical protein